MESTTSSNLRKTDGGPARSASNRPLTSRTAAARPPHIVRARRLKLEPTDTVEETFAKAVARAREQIEGNLEAAIDGRDPDGVHQMRVGLRRLRSIISLFNSHLKGEAKSVDQGARHCLKALGSARDLDVFINETLPAVENDHRKHDGLMRLAERANKRRSVAYRNLRNLLGDPASLSFLSLLDKITAGDTDILQKPDTQIGMRAPKLVQKRYKRVCNKGKGFEGLPTAKRHKVRIALKQFRYACDYFQSLYPTRKTGSYLNQLKKLQEELGLLNDAAVASELAFKLAGRDELAVTGARLIESWENEQVARRDSALVDAWQQFSETRPFWAA